MSRLELDDVTRVYRRGPETVRALAGVSLRVEAGLLVAVAGASGSGKSTLLHIAGGVDRPTSGSVHLDGRRVDDLPERELTRLRRRHVGMVFQDFFLVPGLTAIQNVRLPLLFSGGGGRPRQADELLERVGLAGRASFLPHQLSGGERQRVAIARALVHSPSLLLADEPTGQLGSDHGDPIVRLLLELAGSTGLAILLATHDETLAGKASVVHRLKDGRLGSGRD